MWLYGRLTSIVSSALALVVLLSATAVAQVEQAQLLTEQAREAFQAGDFSAAADLYGQAFDADPHPVILYNQARCYEELQEDSLALTVLRRALSLNPNERTREAIGLKVEELVIRLVDGGYRLAEVEPDVLTQLARLSITSLPSGGQIFIGEDYVGNTPLDDLWIAPGEYDLTVTMEGYQPSYRTIEVLAGRDVNVHTGLRRSGDITFQPADPGYLDLAGPRNGMQVYLDEDYYGRTPLNEIPVPPGRYSLRVTHDLYEDWSTEIDVASGEVTSLYATAERKASTLGGGGFSQTSWGLLSLGVGGASLVTGAIVGIIALADEDRYHRNVTSPNREDIRDSAITEAFIADMAFVTAGVFVITGAILILTDSGDEEDDVSPDLLQLSIGPTGSGWGVGWGGTF